MVVSQADLIRMVRIKMNEDPRSDDIATGIGHSGLMLDSVISSVANEEIEKALEVTVFTGFDDLQRLKGEITVKRGVGLLRLPEDFHRLVELKVSGWEEPVTEAEPPTGSGYWRRKSASMSVRGTPSSPRAYIVKDVEGAMLELHPCETGAVVEYGDYVSNPWKVPAGSYYVPDRMIGTVTTAIALKAREIVSQP